MSPSCLFGWLWLGILLFTSPVVGQPGRTSVWYFGQNAGLDFRSGSPVVLSDGAMVTGEGCASLCDKEGNLLFYTDGVSIYNRQHQRMPHGTGLKGHDSSTQSAIVVPKPGDPFLYYIFTAPGGGYLNIFNEGVNYSLVDMRLDNGLGDVVETSKNTLLYKPATEKLVAVRHRNGTDVWVITHEWGSNLFRTYQISAGGVLPYPVESAVGTPHQGNDGNTAGYLKASPSGSQLALALNQDSLIELLDFNTQSGQITHPRTLQTPDYDNAYGVEFSPDETKLYATAGHYDPSEPRISRSLWQFNLSSGLFTAGQLIAEHHPNQGFEYYTLQTGPDGKIYVARTNAINASQPFLGVIHQPNEAGLACQYQDQAIDLRGDRSNPYRGGLGGLPNFIPDLVLPVAFSHRGACLGDTTRFQLANASQFTSASWQFGDLASGNANIASGFSPGHVFSDTGRYAVQVKVIFKDGSQGAWTNWVHILSPPSVQLGKDTLLCPGQHLLLRATSPEATYYWQNGATQDTFLVEQAGTYWVTVSRENCWVRDSIVVGYTHSPTVNLGDDAIICDGLARTLDATQTNGRYRWSDGSTQSSLQVGKSGWYWVEVTNSCGTVRDSVRLTYESAPELNLGNDTTLCVGQTLRLDVRSPKALNYRWNTGLVEPVLSVNTSGWYSVEVKGATCLVRDSIFVQFEECAEQIFIPNVFTPNGDGQNETFEVRGILPGKWQLAIYNRYGQAVYRSEGYRNDWHAEGDSSGLYYYLLLEKGSKRSYRGWVEVLR